MKTIYQGYDYGPLARQARQMGQNRMVLEEIERMRPKKKNIKRIFKEMSWQDRLFGIFLLGAAVSLITLGMTLVGSDGVLILLGSMCFYFVTSIYRLNKEKELPETPAESSETAQRLVENLVKRSPEVKQRELVKNLVDKKTEDKHSNLVSDLRGKR
ncbi:MAG: hypothetical protein GY762_18380 [Proteobacteria bacterium]|nr:hypothetical protein [Pseudomonadota bacterium]